MLVSVLVPASGVEELFVVEEARGPNEHEAVLFDAGVGEITLHFESARRSILLPVIIHQYNYYNHPLNITQYDS